MRGAPPIRRALARLRLGHRVAVALAVLAGGAALTACGIPTEAAAHAIAPTPKVNAPSPVTTTTVKTTLAGTVPLTVFFIYTGIHLVAEQRLVKPPASVTTAIDTLLAGPTTRELYSDHVTTALGSDIKLLRTIRGNTAVTVDFTVNFGALSGTQEVLGVAQVVWTVAEALQSSVGVLFQIDGTYIPVPVASGGSVSVPVHESDYQSLLSPTGTAPTTSTSAP